MKTSTHKPDERGTTLVALLVLLLGFLSLAAGGLLSASSDLKVSRNYRDAMQALVCAEAGLLHAQKVIDDLGVVRFNLDVVPSWSTLFGNAVIAMPANPDCQYTVTATNDASDPIEYMGLASTGNGPDGAQRKVRSRLNLSNVFSPGAIYLPNPNVTSSFQGNKFLVDGNDRNLDGTLSGTQVPGIGTSTSQAAQTVLDSLSAQQKDNVVGIGGDESVFRASGPDSSRITNSIIPGILTQPGVVTNPLLIGNAIFGTLLLPQITHFTGNVTLNGTVSGVGILIVDGGLTLSGTMDFTGLIIVRGTTQITSVTGNSTILGALWTTDLQLNVGGSASVTYSKEAMELVHAIGTGNFLPQRVRTVGWSRS